MMTERDIPHLSIVVASCVAAIGGYAVFSAYAVIWLKDATMTGDVIGTWKSFAVLAFGFWLGSSSGGKAKGEQTKGTPANPMSVEGVKDAEAITIKPESKGGKTALVIETPGGKK